MGSELEKTWYAEKKCPVCGKVFWVSDPAIWAYRLKLRGGKIHRFACSWHCLREYQARKKPKAVPAKAKEIWKLLDKGMIPADVAREMDIPPTVVIYWRDRRMEAEG